MPNARRLAGVACIVVAATAAGCGSSSKSSSSGGSSGGSSSAPTLSKAQFLNQANAICTKGNAADAAAQKAIGNSPSPAQITSYVKQSLVPSVQSQIDAVRALANQTADKTTLTKMLDLAQADVDKVKASPTGLANSNVSPFHDFGVQARSYGLTACAAGS